MSPPNEFANRLKLWVARRSCRSIVYVEFRPSDPDVVLEQWNNVHPIPADLEGASPQQAEGAASPQQAGGAAAEHARRAVESARILTCTGSFVHPDGIDPHQYVLTSAHAVAPIFTSDEPMTAWDLNQFYEPHILCYHREQDHRNGHDNERVFVRGWVAFLSCENDLLVIRLTQPHMEGYCQQEHRPLTFASSFPRPLYGVVMVSWPEVGRRLVSVSGEVSYPNRHIDVLDEVNVFGFTMELSEVNITSESRSSGAPLLDGEGNVVGVLHGGNGRFSFFISFDDLREVLHQWGFILAAPA